MGRTINGHEGPLTCRGFPSELGVSSGKVKDCKTSVLETVRVLFCSRVNDCSQGSFFICSTGDRDIDVKQNVLLNDNTK